MNKDTLVVNLYGGPGCGKSTMAADIFRSLKWSGVECELALEYAKDLVWESRTKTFNNQIYIFGKQHHRIFRLLGQVDVIITDSPILLTPIYDQEKRKYLKKLAIEEYWKNSNANFLLKRKKKYNPKGRNHTENQSKEIDLEIKRFLIDNNISFEEVSGSGHGARKIVNFVKKFLR